MPSFKITLSYDGADFSGWQAQPERRTVQGEFERAWREITGETVTVRAAGRTDAGVHAAGQVVSVESATHIAPPALLLALNAKLPADISVREARLAPAGFHATHDAKRKHYRYAIYNDARRPVFARRYAWHIPKQLDVAAMQQAGRQLIGTHDFVSFQSAGSARESTVRTIFAVEVAQRLAGQGRAEDHEQNSVITIDVEGDGFLYNMVRAIAGTLVAVGRRRRDPAWVSHVLAAQDRCAAGQTAPAHGLTLVAVEY